VLREPQAEADRGIGHAESVDFDLLQCTSCGGYRMRTWSEHRPDCVFHEDMSPGEAGQLRACQGLQRKRLLKDRSNSQ
jgi:hypothetical protein